MPNNVINIVIAGIGGQGVLTASDVLAQVAVRSGFDVKKSEIKGMSQRGGSVTSDVRYGEKVLSPMVPPGKADFLLVLEPTQVDPNRQILKPDGIIIAPDAIDPAQLPNKKSLNVALLGALSAHLALSEKDWLETLRESFPAEFFEPNRLAFLGGRAGQKPAAK
jgi:indolepyruvate ferredoxin oxidoreductase, beta subunit